MPVKAERGGEETLRPWCCSDTCERRGGKKESWEESQIRAQLSESRGQPSGYSRAKIAQLEGSHIVPKEPDSRIPAYFHHWLWAAWGDCVLRLIRCCNGSWSYAEGCSLTALLLWLLSSKDIWVAHLDGCHRLHLFLLQHFNAPCSDWENFLPGPVLGPGIDRDRKHRDLTLEGLTVYTGGQDRNHYM